MDSTGDRNGTGCRGGPRCRRGGAGLRRCRGLRGFREKVPNHGCVGIHEPSRETALSQAEHVRLLQASADVQLQVKPFEAREKGGIGSKLRPKAPEIEHAGGREANPPETVHDLSQLRASPMSPAAPDLPVPVDVGKEVLWILLVAS